jgi:hypothetical protein
MFCNQHEVKNEWVRFPMRSLNFFNGPNISSRTMVLGLAQTLTEISTRNLLGGKRRPAHKANNLTAICEPSLWKMGSHGLLQA